MTLALLTALVLKTVYVAPDGSDAADGSLAHPVATLTQAIKLAGPDGTIHVADGDYTVMTPIVVGANSPHLHIVGSGHAILRGGVEVPKSLWKPTDDARIPRSVRNRVISVDLRRLGITRVPQLQPRGMSHPTNTPQVELFVDEAPQTLARWPNKGYVKTGRIIDGGSVPRNGEEAGRKPIFEFDDDRPSRWGDLSDVWAYGFWRWDWSDESIPVATISGHRVVLAAPHHYGVAEGKPFYFENVAEELDSPGEYYIDRKKNELLFWPSTRNGDAYLSWSDQYLLRVIDGDDVMIEGLRFETSRTTPVEIAGGRGTTLRNCVFRNLGGYGVKVGGGIEHKIVQCRFTDMGAGGIELYGGDRKTLTPANDIVQDCLFERFSRLSRTYRPGVSVNGVGMTVSHCEFRDAPHSAIFFNGNDHTFEGNVFRNVVNSTGDAGAIYAGRDWTKRGTVIRDNLFDDINGLHLYENGVYLDDQLSGITIKRNVFLNCWLGLMVGGGRDNYVQSNLFVKCHVAMHMDARGLGWAKGGYDGLKASLESVPYQSEVWRTRYPGIDRLLSDDPMAPKGNKVAANVLLNSGNDTDSLEAPFRRDSRVEGNVSKTGSWEVSVRDNTLYLGSGTKSALPPELRALSGTKYGPRVRVPQL